MTENPAPALRPPLEVRWRVALDAGYIRLRPVARDPVVVLAAGRELVALDTADGSVRWRQAQPALVAELEACNDGPVISLAGDGEDVELLALRWSGEPLWRTRTGLGTGADGLRGCGAFVIAIGVGVGRSTRQMCQVRDARNGQLVAEFPCPGDLPHVVDNHFIYALRAVERSSGLFVYHAPSGKTRRLLDVGSYVRTVADGMAVIDTYDHGNRFSRLIAVDPLAEKVSWEDAGGPNFVLAADRGQLASATAIDEAHVAMTLRDLKSGQRLWTTEPVKAESVVPVLAADCLAVTVPGERIHVYHRENGNLLQSLEHQSYMVKGGCLTTAGLVEVQFPDVVCFAGTSS